MELLIPRTVRAIMAKGYAEGYAEGLAEGRSEGRKRGRMRMRMISALRAARSRGIDPDSPEFEQFLLDFAADQPDDSRY